LAKFVSKTDKLPYLGIKGLALSQFFVKLFNMIHIKWYLKSVDYI